MTAKTDAPRRAPRPWPLLSEAVARTPLGEMGHELLDLAQRLADYTVQDIQFPNEIPPPINTTILTAAGLALATNLSPDHAPSFLQEQITSRAVRLPGGEKQPGPDWLAGDVDPVEATVQRLRDRYRSWLVSRVDPDGLDENRRITFRGNNVLTQAAKLAEETSPGGLVSGRHLVAGLLLEFQQPGRSGNQAGGLAPFVELGVHPPKLLRDYLQWLIRTSPSDGSPDDLDAWQRALDPLGEVLASMPMSRYAPDTPDGDDLIGIAQDVNSFAGLLSSRELTPPLSVGLFGDWGSGKSFFMRSLQRRIRFLSSRSLDRERQRMESAFHGHVIQVEFNAWHYVETNLWASLVTHIFQELNEHFTQGQAEEEQAEQAEKWEQLLAQLDDQSVLRHGAEKQLESAELALEQAEQARIGKLNSLVEKVGVVWTQLAEDPELSKQTKHLENTLSPERWTQLRRELVLRVDEASDTIREVETFRQTALRSLVHWPFLATCAVVFLLIGIFVVCQVNFPALESLWATLGQITTVVGGGATWLGLALQRAKSTVAAVNKVAQRVTEKLDAVDQRAVRVARQEVEVARENVATLRQRIADIKVQLASLTPNQRLSNFLADRAGSQDYRRYLGLPAMIRRDFARLHSLMNPPAVEVDAAEVDSAFVEGVVSDALQDAVLKSGQPQLGPCRITLHDDGQEGTRTWVVTEVRGRQEVAEDAVDEARSTNPARRDADVATENDPEPQAAAETDAASDASRDPQQLSQRRILVFRQEGERYIGQTRWHNLPRIDRIVLYIDDLDRCPPRRVVEVLQAVHLLLAFPLFVVVVGVDARWVSRSLRQMFSELWQSGTSSEDEEQDALIAGQAATPQDYLEKIFQIPYWIRTMSSDSTKSYLFDLLRPGLAGATVAGEPVWSTSDSGSGTTTPSGGGSSGGGGSGGGSTSGGGSGGGATGGGQPAAGRVDDEMMNPGFLHISREEVDFAKQLSLLVGRTPRGAKRFVNVYRLIRNGLLQSLGDDYVGDDDQANPYHAVQILLAIQIGAAEVAEPLFRMLLNQPADQTLGELIRQLEARRSQVAAHPGLEFLGDEDWKRLVECLTALRGVGCEQITIGLLQQHAGRVAQFSFRIGVI